MAVSEMNLSWIVVSDLDEAIDYYTNVIGLKLAEKNADFGWAELVGENGGMRLGLARSQSDEMPAGKNAVITMTVGDIEKAKEELAAKGVQFRGETMEVPGHVKLQFFSDKDGNQCQLVEKL